MQVWRLSDCEQSENFLGHVNSETVEIGISVHLNIYFLSS